MRAKYEHEKTDLFNIKTKQVVEVDYNFVCLNNFVEKKSAEETMKMLKRIASIAYTHEKKIIQSWEFDFIGKKEQQAQRNDERGTQSALYEAQEKT